MVTLNSKHRTNKKKRKHRKATKISFPRQQKKKKADQDKSVLNKIMIT